MDERQFETVQADGAEISSESAGTASPGSASDSEASFASIYHYALQQRLRHADIALQESKYPHFAFSFKGKIIDRKQIRGWLRDPARFECQLRALSRWFYDVNGQYRRLCNYQPNMVDFAYSIYPAIEVPEEMTEEQRTVLRRDYLNVAKMLNNMGVRAEIGKLLTPATRDGVVYAYAVESGDAFCMTVLDPDYCRVCGLDKYGCLCYEFNFAFFNRFSESDRKAMLKAYGSEFQNKYQLYMNDRKQRWQEIGDNGCCLKYQEDRLTCSLPPYIAVIEPLLDLEDYKKLSKAREEAGNYNLLAFHIPTDDRGTVLLDREFVNRFIDQAASELPESVGILMSPMEMEKFNFAKDTTVADRSSVTDAEEQFWNASGVSNLLFGTAKSSANALSKSIISDENDIFPLVRQAERWINRRLRSKQSGTRFRIRILDITAFNRRDMFDTYLKAGNAGLPVKNVLAAALGYTPYEVIVSAQRENDVLRMRDVVYNQPLLSTSTTPAEDLASAASAGSEGGRPQISEDELTPEGEATRVNERNIRE